MNSIDFISMIGHLSQSLASVDRLFTGVAYLVGLLFIANAIMELKVIADKRARSAISQKMMAPTAYLIIGTLLIALPSAVHVTANTFFGSSNILSYSPQVNPMNILNSMPILVQTAGILFFIRIFFRISGSTNLKSILSTDFQPSGSFKTLKTIL